MKGAETQLDDVKNKSDTMTPEDRVTQTMDLLEDIREKVDALMEYVLQEEELLPQGKHILIRGVHIQSCSAGARNFTKYVFFHVQFSGLVQNSQNYCAISVKLKKKKNLLYKID